MVCWTSFFVTPPSPLIQLFSKHQNVCKRVKYLQQFLLLSFNVLTKSPVRHPPLNSVFFSLLFEQTSKVFANPLHVMESHKPIYSWVFRLIKTKLSLHTHPDRRSCIMSSSGHSKSGQQKNQNHYPSEERGAMNWMSPQLKRKGRFTFCSIFIEVLLSAKTETKLTSVI